MKAFVIDKDLKMRALRTIDPGRNLALLELKKYDEGSNKI